MLTMPKEIVPLQMARGARLGLDFRSAISDIKNITISGSVEAATVAVWVDSPRAPDRACPGSGRGRPACRLERAAEGLGASTRPGHPGCEPECRDLIARLCRGLVLAGEARPGAAGMGDRHGVSGPRAALLHRAIGRLSTW